MQWLQKVPTGCKPRWGKPLRDVSQHLSTTTLSDAHAAAEIGLWDGSSRPQHSAKRVIRENRTVESDGLCPRLLRLTKGPPHHKRRSEQKISAAQPPTANESNEAELSEARMLRAAL